MNNAEIFAAVRAAQEAQKAAEIEDCWGEGEAMWEDYICSTYRGRPLPDDLRRFIRNDPVADLEETRQSD